MHGFFITYNYYRCIDSLQVSRGGGGFGFIETCGTNIPSELASSLDSGRCACTSIKITVMILYDACSLKGRFKNLPTKIVQCMTDIHSMQYIHPMCMK